MAQMPGVFNQHWLQPMQCAIFMFEVSTISTSLSLIRVFICLETSFPKVFKTNVFSISANLVYLFLKVSKKAFSMTAIHLNMMELE